MKKIILGIFITITTLLSVSCAKEMDAPCSTPISGKWANDVWADRYIMFEAGYIYEYVSDEAYYVCDKILWNCMDSDFDQFAANRYSIVDGKLVTKTLNEKITVQDSVMMIGDQKYVLIEEFNEEQYSKILPSSENLVKYTYAAQSVEWNYSIENPVDGQKLEVVAPDWVTDVLVTDGKITFNVPESKEDKQGKFILHYDTADDVEISVTQTAARSINVNKTSTWGYAASDCSISYTIENPEESFVLEAEVDKDWISDVKVNEGNISFKVSENNTGSSRTATLKLSYPEAKDVEIVITQTYSASSITVSPASGSCDYTGGDFEFTYSVSNPREGESLTAKSSADWITGVTVSGNKVAYNVSENNSGSSRIGRIILAYAGVSKTFSVTQTYSAVGVSTSPTSGSCNYAGGDFEFTYTISNPREGESLTAKSGVSWITGVSVSGNKVSYKVSLNTTGSSRTGNINLTYADKTLSFKVSQSAAELTMSSASASHDYSSATSSFDYSITDRQSSLELTLNSNVDWITGLTDNGTNVSYAVSENNSGSSRTGKITLTYAGVSKTFSVVQSYSASSISVSPSSQSCDYTGGDFEFTYTVNNPREGESLTAKSEVDWITGVTVSGNKVTYNVSENNSGSSRTGKITLTYAGVNKVFTITQQRGPVILSSSESANCYIVSSSGYYSFNAVKGNSSTSVGSVSYAQVLWESFGTSTTPSVGDLVKNVAHKDGYITFEASDKKGNAVIAAKDASGNILWSWHIWLTDKPAEHVYKNNAGTMMDRNLGATSATPGDVGALGLLYQWGRKDPFLGSSSISRNTLAASTLTWPSRVSSDASTGTIDYVTANPTTYVYCSSYSNSYDWHYGSRNNTLWQSEKTIYDPCPPGWRVPDGGSSGVWSTAIGSSSYFYYSYDSTNEGINFSGKFGSASTIWYPASGYRDSIDGGLDNVGYSGFYWSVTPYSNSADYLYFNNGGHVYPSNDGPRAYGFAVRCLQVIDEVAEP